MIAICDDQKECNAKLKELLQRYFNERKIDNFKIKEYITGNKLINEYSPNMFNFIFLDIQMPNLSGLETTEQIRKQDLKVDIIFVTNMSDQMHMGFNYNAKGFLIKEVNQEQINVIMDRLLAEMHRREDIGTYTIKQKFDKGNAILRLSEILYFESHDKDITAKTIDGNFEFRKKLSVLEEELDGKGFIRINRSLLVNTLHVFKDFGDCIILRNSNEKLPIGINYKATVRKAFSIKE